jgi:ferredoxin--NADP+ reductase
MVGLPQEGRPLTRAYSIASANHDDYLEFFSIKVPNGPLTSKLQHLAVGDEIVVSRKPTGTLVLRDLRPRRHLYMLSTGTGLAPFISLIQDPETYERFAKVVLIHGVRWVKDLAYSEFISEELAGHEFFADLVRDKLIYYPTVTREPFQNQGRITNWSTAAGCLPTSVCRHSTRRTTARWSAAARMIKDCCEPSSTRRGFQVSPLHRRPGRLRDRTLGFRGQVARCACQPGTH